MKGAVLGRVWFIADIRYMRCFFIDFDSVDEEFEKEYEGRTIKYNLVTQPDKPKLILSEEELEDTYDYDEDYDDEEFEDDEETGGILHEESFKDYDEARERKVQYYRDQIKKLNSNG